MVNVQWYSSILVNNTKMKFSFLKYCFSIILITELTYAQENKITEKNKINKNDYEERIQLNNENKLMHSLNVPSKNFENTNTITLNFYQIKKETKYSFDIINSVGSNISFGGFFDKYAVLNFTPKMFIKPTDFLSIYGNQNLYCLIPIQGIKDHITNITIQGLAVLAIDNSMKIFFPESQWIPQLISFAAKNLIINGIIKSSIERNINSPFPILEFDDFYYSVSINF